MDARRYFFCGQFVAAKLLLFFKSHLITISELCALVDVEASPVESFVEFVSIRTGTLTPAWGGMASRLATERWAQVVG